MRGRLSGLAASLFIGYFALTVRWAVAAGVLSRSALLDLSNDWIEEELKMPCVADSSQPGCKSFTYPAPYAAQDLASLCSQMPFMPTCTLLAACDSASTLSPVSKTDQHVCEPVNLLATVCKLDGMAGMRGCTGYNKLCGDGSAVQQCDTDRGLAALPTTDAVDRLVRSICGEMSMDGCELCVPDWKAGKKYASCDLLSVYARLCVEMPGMAQCAAWHGLCSADKSLYLCSADGKGNFQPGPSMLMYFNGHRPFYLLFKFWTPGPGVGPYLASWLAIFLLGVVFELLQVFKSRMEVQWREAALERQEARHGGSPLRERLVDLHELPEPAAQWQRQPQPAQASGRRLWHTVPALTQVPYRLHSEDFGRAGLTLVTMGVAYLLMLAAMSFNTGIFFAVITGVATGTLMFGQFRRVDMATGTLVGAHSDDMACCTGA